MNDPATLHGAVRDEMAHVLIGKQEIVERLTIALLTRGHVLLEGVPGVAKTTIAKLFARSLNLSYRRIQMTPDILPADITGTHVYREATGEFQLQKGPIFANIVVADELNRATPKTQSALLEAMQEGNVTIEGDTLALPEPFMVVATQNPIELEGTFTLAEAQRDRFQMKLTTGIPTRDEEANLLDRFDADPTIDADVVEPVVANVSIQSAREAVASVHVDSKVKTYILDLVDATRDHPDVEYGGSPRASMAFINTTKALGAIRGRDYVIPDDVKALAAPILVHRLVLSTDADLSDVTPEAILDDILETVPVPGGQVESDASRAVGDGGTADEADGDV
jgi:MoxR-like ATPase